MRALTGILLTATLLGCAAEEKLNPVATADAGVMDAGGGGGSGGAPGDAGAPKRTVSQRNPFGNVGVTENLLWDGDFELMSPFSDQYGWLAGSSPQSLDFALPTVKLGAECRSGLRCVLLKKKHVIAGIGVASAGNKLRVSFWAHVQDGNVCSKVTGILTSWTTQTDDDVALHPVTDQPGEGGWCWFEGVVEARKGKPLLYIDNNTDGEVLIDDAVVQKAPAEMAILAHHGPMTPEVSARSSAAHEALSRLRGPHDAPPNAARRAYESWRKR